jgi:hypothetical protein
LLCGSFQRHGSILPTSLFSLFSFLLKLFDIAPA